MDMNTPVATQFSMDSRALTTEPCPAYLFSPLVMLPNPAEAPGRVRHSL